MNLKILLIFLFCIANTTFGQSKKLSNPLLEKSLKKDSITAEFTELYNLINIIHPGQYMFCSKKEFEQTYLNLKKSIKTDISPIEYYKITATLLAKIKDGHTTTDRNKIISQLKERLVFPFSIYKIKNNFYLDKSTLENKNYTGLQILKINGKNIASIVYDIQKYIHLEGHNESGLNFRFRNFPFYYFIYNPSENFEIEYVDSQNHHQKVEIKGLTYGDFNKNTNENIEHLTTEINSLNIGILKFHSFENGYNEADRKIAERQLDVFFSKLDSLKIRNLVIDLRDNSGGAAEIANYLFSYLTSKPYNYFDYVGAKYRSVKDWKHYAQYPNNIEEINLNETNSINGLNCYTNGNWWFDKQFNKSNFYKGNISVLINGGCFSTTGHLLALLREYKIGKFYGEYSQGSNYSNAGGQAFILPYSKTVVWIPTFQYKMRTPNFQYDPNGIKPDVYVPIEPDDLKTKFDRQMGFVLKQIEENK
ncbi:S41 family peptidase [Chryseobacterium gwangjuense]|uniref:S41 family peptidase n=1 Tax=Chryseobacterium gwangjuense TaxID=1069980 RepID=UPI001E3ADB66|nr:S41 family peptidase [Chryseobacterium gwangjuense]MCE3076183.1 S41 family peptidase [Chryseobacterium gwangjuense]